MASRQGNAIAGFEASDVPAAADIGLPLVWNALVAASCELQGWELMIRLGDVREQCRARRGCRILGFAAIRATATILLVEFMVARSSRAKEGREKRPSPLSIYAGNT